MTLSVDKFGRLLIPKALRRHLRIEPGDTVIVTLDDDTHSINISADQEGRAEVTFTEWGFPIINSPGEFPTELKDRNLNREGYEEHFRQRLDS